MSHRTSVTTDACRSLRWAIWFGLLGVWLGSISAINRVSPDLYHEMALLREALASGSVPTHDVFAYTPTVDPCVHHEWGAGAVFYALSMGLGSAGMTLLKYGGALAVGLGCCAWPGAGARVTRSSHCWPPWRSSVAASGSSRSVPSCSRCSSRSACCTCSNTTGRVRRGWILVWLPLYVVWLNMHAGFLVGVGLFGIYSAGRWAEEFAQHRSLRQAFHATAPFAGRRGGHGVLFPAIRTDGGMRRISGTRCVWIARSSRSGSPSGIFHACCLST